MKKFFLYNIFTIILASILFTQHFNVHLDDTGESQLTIFADSITNLDVGDEVGVFDLDAITNYNDCSSQIGELLVGAGIWNGSQLNIVSIGSVDLCSFGGPQLAGFVEGNDVVVRVYKADEGVEYETVVTWQAGTGAFGDIVQSVSEIALGTPCEDDNSATSGLGGCAGAVAALGCDFIFGGSLISELCPETCDECEEVLGCTSEDACNYDVFATEDDGSCIYAEDLVPWCDDTDGDSLGAGSQVYSCTQPFVDEFIFSWVNDCSDLEPDCATNDTDECGVCSGGNVNEDCTGVCFGDASEDCAGVCEGSAVFDECGICNGDNSSCSDCEGIPNGTAYIDNCGLCDNNPSNDCVQDCAGIWGGDSTADQCGLCNGNETACDGANVILGFYDLGGVVLTNISYEDLTDIVCIEDVIISDGAGISLDTFEGDCVYLSNSGGDVPIYMRNNQSIGGFQFSLNGLAITGAYGGGAQDAGFMVSTSETMVLGFSLTGSSIDPSGDFPGCTDGLACNYNSEATEDNGSCEYPEENFDCNGNCVVEIDCSGICGGNAQIDECGICEGPGAIYDCGCYEGIDGLCIAYEDIQEIFNANCTSYCHSGGGVYTGNLDLSSYENLTAGTSEHGPVIIPFDSDSSILIQKLSDNPPFGNQMPSDAPPLEQDLIDIIALWIDEGANPPEGDDFGDDGGSTGGGGDGGGEEGCADNEFDCGDGTCIYGSWACDGYVDCANGSDEADCSDGGDSECYNTECGYYLLIGLTCEYAIEYGADCSICIEEGFCDDADGGDDGGGLEPFGELDFGNVDFENKTVEILMNCIYPVSAFTIDVSGIVVNSAFGGDAGDLEFDITTTDSGVSGYSTGEYIPENNGLLTILEYNDVTSDQLCFEYSSITTYIGIEYEAILGDCVDFSSVGEEDLLDIEIPLHEGNNLISFYGLPEDTNIDNVMGSLGENISGVIGEGYASTLIPGVGWVGSLNNIESTSGYWVKVNNEDVLLLFDAIPTDPGIIYNLHEGMNLISFPSVDSVGVSDAIPDSLETSVSSIITEGFAAIQISPGIWAGSLTQFMGSKGYWIELDQDILFNFENLNLSRKVNYFYNPSYIENKEYYQSSQQAFYFFKNIEEVDIGDVIEVYEGDVLVGSREWTGPYTDIPVMGDDYTDYTNGYCVEGSIPRFKLIKTSGVEHWLEGSIEQWKNNELYLSGALQIAKEIPDKIILNNVYPNPFNPSTMISFELPVDIKVILDIYDINGNKIYNLYNGYKESGFHQISWDAHEYSSGIYFVKIIAGEYINTKKVMLIK